MASPRTRIRRADRRPSVWGALRITPMIDVVFLLLLYFMLNARFAPDERVFRVSVPRADAAPGAADPFALPERPITINVRSVGVGGQGYTLTTDSTLLPSAPSLDALAGALAEARGRALGPNQRFFIRPESGAIWEHTLGAFDAVVRSGFTNVRFTEPGP